MTLMTFIRYLLAKIKELRYNVQQVVNGCKSGLHPSKQYVYDKKKKLERTCVDSLKIVCSFPIFATLQFASNYNFLGLALLIGTFCKLSLRYAFAHGCCRSNATLNRLDLFVDKVSA